MSVFELVYHDFDPLLRRDLLAPCPYSAAHAGIGVCPSFCLWFPLETSFCRSILLFPPTPCSAAPPHPPPSDAPMLSTGGCCAGGQRACPGIACEARLQADLDCTIVRPTCTKAPRRSGGVCVGGGEGGGGHSSASISPLPLLRATTQAFLALTVPSASY